MNIPFSRPTAKRSAMTFGSTLCYLAASATMAPVDGGLSTVSVGADLLKTLLGGILSKKAEVFYNWGEQKFTEGNSLNHHLRKALVGGIQQAIPAFRKSVKDYLDTRGLQVYELADQHLTQEREALTAFCQHVQGLVEDEGFWETQEEPIKALLHQPEEAFNYLISALYEYQLADIPALRQLRSYAEASFVLLAQQSKVYFIEYLKNPNHTQHWRAYQLLQFQQMREGLNGDTGDTPIDSKAWKQLLRECLEEIPVFQSLEEGTEKMLESVQQIEARIDELPTHLAVWHEQELAKLNQLLAEISKTKENTEKILKDTEVLKEGVEEIQEQMADMREELIQTQERRIDKFLGPGLQDPYPFYGREEELQEIANRLDTGGETPILFVKGLGGIGKTTLAKKYAFRKDVPYQYVAYVPFTPVINSEESHVGAGVRSSLLTALGQHFEGLGQEGSLSESDRFSLLCRQLVKLKGRKLLIIDNLDHQEEVDHLTLSLPHWQVLVTTRIHPVNESQAFTLSGLSQESALRLFQVHCPGLRDENTEVLVGLLQRIHYHPLLTELLARVLQAKQDMGWKLVDLEKALKKEGLLGMNEEEVYLSGKAQESGKSKDTVWGWIEGLFDLSALELSEQRSQLLSAMSVLSPEGQSPLQWAFLLDREVGELRKELQRLWQLGWIQQRENPQGEIQYGMHPMIQEVMQHASFWDLEHLKTPLSRLYNLLIKEELLLIIPFKNALESFVSKFGYSYRNPVFYSTMGSMYKQLGNLYLAGRYVYFGHEQLVEQVKSNPDSEQLQRDLSVSLMKLGDLANARGESQEAKSRYEQSLGIRKLLAESNPDSEQLQRDLSVSYNKLGDLANARGESQEAKSRYEQSLGIAQLLAESNPDSEQLQRDLSISL